jgi:hypothetical protein
MPLGRHVGFAGVAVCFCACPSAPLTGNDAGCMSADDPTIEDLVEQIRGLKLAQFLLSTTVTLASLAYGKLDAGELAEARLAIDALAALVPLLEGDAKRDLGATLSNLQLAYADAVAAASPPSE